MREERAWVIEIFKDIVYKFKMILRPLTLLYSMYYLRLAA